MRGDEERNEVGQMLGELKKLARRFSVSDLRSGEWLAPFVSEVLEDYAGEVDKEHFDRTYPGQGPDEIIEYLIARAQRRAAVAAGLTSGFHTTTVWLVLGSGWLVPVISVPAGVVTYVGGMFFQTLIQLRLAYDISVLYGYPVDLDDPEQVRDLLLVSLGTKPDDELDIDPDDDGVDASDVARYVTRGVSRLSRKTLSTVGRRMIRRSLIKITVPAVSVPLSAVMSYRSAGKTAKLAQQVYRDKAAAEELVPKVSAAAEDDPELLLDALVLIMRVDKEGRPEESWLLDTVTAALEESEEGAEAVVSLRSKKRAKADEVLDRIAAAAAPVQREIYHAVSEAAIIDHELSRRERKLLKRMAKAAGTGYDEDALERSVKNRRVR